jgi:hypothetical protein
MMSGRGVQDGRQDSFVSVVVGWLLILQGGGAANEPVQLISYFLLVQLHF